VPEWRQRALLGLLAVPFLLGAAAAPSSRAEIVFSFQDSRITESSGLVALGTGLFVTTNDSGDEARVFTVDSDGETVGVSHWAGDAHDVEALAPAGGGEVWVGDIGDNRASRDTVQVTQVAVGRGDRDSDEPVYELAYPDGSHDAETLLAAPDGRLYIVTKGFLGGSVYAAPPVLDPDHVNRLEKVAGGILPMATDGTFLPDGRHVLVRGYAGAVVYTYPGFERVGPVPLPNQPQGEGLAVADDGTIYLSSEGRGSDVLRLPVSGLCPDGGGICAAGSSASTSASQQPVPVDDPAIVTRTNRAWWPWVAGGAIVAVVIGLQVRLSRRR
jgi:hypothetical protein